MLSCHQRLMFPPSCGELPAPQGLAEQSCAAGASGARRGPRPALRGGCTGGRSRCRAAPWSAPRGLGRPELLLARAGCGWWGLSALPGTSFAPLPGCCRGARRHAPSRSSVHACAHACSRALASVLASHPGAGLSAPVVAAAVPSLKFPRCSGLCRQSPFVTPATGALPGPAGLLRGLFHQHRGPRRSLAPSPCPFSLGFWE